VRHYGLNLGLLQAGDVFDAVEVDDPVELNVRRTFVRGHLVAEDGRSLWPRSELKPRNKWVRRTLNKEDLSPHLSADQVRVMVATDGSLITEARCEKPPLTHGRLVAAPERDLLLLTCVNRYQLQKPAVGLVSGFGLRKGALASSVSHDSHNLIGVGASADALLAALQAVMDHSGGIALCADGQTQVLPLPVAGLMSLEDGDGVAKRYAALEGLAKSLGSTLKAPFMTLSFMALLVLPHLKISDRGLFDGDAFAPTTLVVQS
jgi:adenine deaminase